MSYFKAMLKDLENEQLKESLCKQQQKQTQQHIPNERNQINRPYSGLKLNLISQLLPTRVRRFREMENKKSKLCVMKLDQLKFRQSRVQCLQKESFLQRPMLSQRKSPAKQVDVNALKAQIQSQMMQKILTLLQNERKSGTVSIPMASTPVSSAKQHPIVINNYMRETPAEKIDRSIIEKEIKIQLLQQQRKHSRQTDLSRYRSLRPSIQDCKIDLNMFTKHHKTNSDQQISVSPINQYYQANMVTENISSIKKSKQNSSICHFPSNQLSERKTNNEELQVGGFQVSTSRQNPATSKFCFPQQSFALTKRESKDDQTCTEQQKQSARIVKDQSSAIKRQQRLRKRTENSLKIQKKQTQEQIKRPVLFEIPFNDQNEKTISLAEAFKKRVGGLSSDKVRLQRSKSRIAKKEEANTTVLTKQISIKKESPKAKKRVIRQKKGQGKQNIKIDKYGSETVSVLGASKVSREPSHELMDRLITGSRVKLSKKQMHALTKKNYEKLPQVRQKKEQQRKRQEELERLNRVKTYQKQLRSSSSFCIN